jgi:hypothetical protein
MSKSCSVFSVSPPAAGRAQVRRHDEHRVLEVDVRPLASVKPAVVHHLQQNVEHIRMRLLDLVEENHRVGPAMHGLGQLAALVVAHVARRRANQPRHGVLLHVLAHVDANHGLLVVEEKLGQRARGFGLAHAGRPRKMKLPIGRLGSLRPARERRMALATTVSAASWPTTRSRSRVSISTSFFTSPSSMRETGMPVHLLTMPAMSSSSTSSFNMRATPALPSCAALSLLQLRFELGQLAVLDLRGALQLPLRVCSSASKRSASMRFFNSLMWLMASRSLVQRARSAVICSVQFGHLALHFSRRSMLFASVSRFSASRSISSDVFWRSS